MRILHLIRYGHGALGNWSTWMDRHLALRKAGADSKVLCEHGADELSHIMELEWKSGRIEKRFFHMIRKNAGFFGLSHVPELNSLQLSRTLKNMEYDILHFISCRNFTSYFTFPSLTRHKPAIFTMSSMSNFTGSCFHSLECDRWKTGCIKCPYAGVLTPSRRDLPHREWKLKDWFYRRSKLTVVAPSNWMTEQVKQSMLKCFPIHYIPHGTDTEVHRPLDQKQCRLELGISPAKKVLMFASDRMGDHLKGGDLLLNALEGLPRSLKSDIVLLLMGKGGEEIFKTVSINTLNVGYISDNHRKAMCYSAADLFLFPTRAENSGTVAIESMACGTPVVSFRVGGVPEPVRPGITGYLAEPENADDFRKGIIELLEDETLRKNMGQYCREIAVREYDIKLWAQRFIQLCKSMQ